MQSIIQMAFLLYSLGSLSLSLSLSLAISLLTLDFSFGPVLPREVARRIRAPRGTGGFISWYSNALKHHPAERTSKRRCHPWFLSRISQRCTPNTERATGSSVFASQNHSVSLYSPSLPLSLSLTPTTYPLRYTSPLSCDSLHSATYSSPASSLKNANWHNATVMKS